ncbi:MAG TPA: zinc ribbon domain-containing protein [Pyrinomonadaceae bacterium]|nr:zinc ribbon domain-containing protein [Pyrinomonadaceae bacterium]
MKQVKCPNCGEANPAKYKFCPHCRTALDVKVEPTSAALAEARAGTPPAQPIRPKSPAPDAAGSTFSDRDHLFETVEETTGRRGSYLKLFGVVAVAVVIAGGVIGYMTLATDVGDKVKAPTDMELAIRDHFLLVQKRTATDIETYYCGDYYWSRVGVETRVDMPNPLLRVNKYTARATPAPNNTWSITAAPVTSPEMDEPCR